MGCTFLYWALGFVPIDMSGKTKPSVSTLSENHFACVSGKHVLTLDTHRCCLSHRYRAGRLHLFTLLTIMPLLNSSCRVIPALSWVSGGFAARQESRCSVVLKMAMFLCCSKASFSAQDTAFVLTLLWLKWMAGGNGKLSFAV